MATISNVKNVDMQQLEFQNIGKSPVQVVLQQPLLKNTSTYTSELVSMEISLDALPLYPEGEEFFSVGMRPIGGSVADLDRFNEMMRGDRLISDLWWGDLIPDLQNAYSAWMDEANAAHLPELGNLTNYLWAALNAGADPNRFDETCGMLYGAVVYFRPELLTGVGDIPPLPVPVAGIANEQFYHIADVANLMYLDRDSLITHNIRGEAGNSVRFRNYTSRTGMLHDLTEQVGKLGAKLRVRSDVVRYGMPARNWMNVPDDERYIILETMGNGQLRLKIRKECFRDYYFRLGDGFRRLFGRPDFEFLMGIGNQVFHNQNQLQFPNPLTMNDGGTETLDVALALPGGPGAQWLYSLSEPNGAGRFFNHDRIPGSEFYHAGYPNWRYNRFVYFETYDYATAPLLLTISSEVPFCAVEVPTRKLIVEASYPVSHTTCWRDDTEEHRMQFQEFTLKPEMRVSVGISSTNPTSVFYEKLNTGPSVFLDNAGTLALKKLFEGQLQALRIDVLEEREDDDDVRTRVPVKLLDHGFMYLKWLFTKETV